MDTPAGAGAYSACTSPREYTSSAPGAYTFWVRAKDAAMYARLRPLIEESVEAIAGVLTALDRLAPEPLPDTEKAVTNR